MSGQRSIAREGLVVVIVLLLFELIFVGWIAISLSNLQALLQKERHRVAIISTSAKIAAMTQKLGFVFVRNRSNILPTSSKKDDEFETLILRLLSQLNQLKMLAGDDPKALAIFAEHERVRLGAIKVYQEDVAIASERQKDRRIKSRPLLLNLDRGIAKRYQTLVSEYKASTEIVPDRLRAQLNAVKYAILGGVIGNLLLFVLLAFALTRRVARGANELSTNFERYKNGQVLLDLRSQVEELSLLDLHFRQMTDAIDRAAQNEATLVADASDLIFTINAQGKLSRPNAASQALLGYAPESLRDKSWMVLIPPVEQVKVRRFFAGLEEAEQSSAIDVNMVRQDGALLGCRLSCFFAAKEQITYCFVSDISSIKTAREELLHRQNNLRALMLNLPVGLLLTDDDGHLLMVNGRMEQLMHGAIGSKTQTIDDIFDGGGLYPAGLLERAIASSPLRCSIRLARGERLACELTARKLQQTDRVLIIVEDIRDKIKLENLRRDFVLLLRKNLGTPIVRVQELLATLKASDNKEQARIDRASLNARRLLGLIEELLQIEELSKGKLVSALRPVNVVDIARAATDALSDYAQSQSIALVADVPDLTVMADFERTLQVVINLLSNAIKFSPKGSTVGLQISGSGEQVEFCVVDQGRGVSPDMREHIFAPYRQAKVTDSSRGIGLGLSICRTIVELHGGTIGVKDADQGGSIFWFRLPVARPSP
jgi:PAS domain S-box-containing protein